MGQFGAAKLGGWNSPDLASLSEDCLSAAEDAAQKVVNCVRPTLDSEEKRRDVVDYVQRLIKTHLNCEVFPYGSVPLKTYLPDGDIDLTAFEGFNAEKSLALDVLAVLQKEEHNEFAEFQVKDTHFIDAEVKLVKCLVRNIVIDISFNQLGGLATLCFLEQVDRLVGRNHLFKRSIILVKTWCYYESRILGAHHGLISTYALETLVLYIFHLFHSSLNGPLTVLYKFLDYYGQFDWDNYCISLRGPVCKSSLPEVVVKIPESGWDNLMLSEEFLENCMDMFSFTSRAVDGKPKTFQAKHLNIIDPLRENNNLGRSVNTGNFYRIRSAFKYGARKLGQILVQPKDKITDELNKFFTNTLARHGNDNTGSIQPIAFEFGDDESLSASIPSPVEFLSEDDILLKSSISDIDLDNIALESKNWTSELFLEQSSQDYSSLMNGASDYEPSSNCTSFLSWNHNRKLYSFPAKLSAQTGSSEIGYFCRSNFVDLGSCKFGMGSLSLDTKGHYAEANEKYQWCSLGSSVAKANIPDCSSLDFREVDWKSTGGESEAFNPLADLGGDYDSHVRSLLYGQLCHGLSLLAASRHPPSFPSGSQWVPFQQRQFTEMSSYPQYVKKSKHQDADSASPLQNAHVAGTYFPHSNGFTQERPLQGRNRNKPPGKGNFNQFHRYSPNNIGSYTASGEQNYFQNGSRIVPNARNKSKGWGKFDASLQSPRSDDNGSETGGSCKIEFGSIGNLAEEVISASGDVHSPMKQGRSAVPSIRLKNEAEFPPLCQ